MGPNILGQTNQKKGEELNLLIGHSWYDTCGPWPPILFIIFLTQLATYLFPFHYNFCYKKIRSYTCTWKNHKNIRNNKNKQPISHKYNTLNPFVRSYWSINVGKHENERLASFFPSHDGLIFMRLSSNLRVLRCTKHHYELTQTFRINENSLKHTKRNIRMHKKNEHDATILQIMGFHPWFEITMYYPVRIFWWLFGIETGFHKETRVSLFLRFW